MTGNDRLERFADLAVRVGANVQPGSGVLLTANTATTSGTNSGSIVRPCTPTS